MSASVVSGVDTAPVLEPCEHVLDPMALAIENAVVVVLDAVAGMGRDAGSDTLVCQGLAEGGGAVGPVGEQEAGGRQLIDHSSSGLVIVGLPLAQVQQQRSSLVVAHHLQFAGQAAPAASDTSG